MCVHSFSLCVAEHDPGDYFHKMKVPSIKKASNINKNRESSQVLSTYFTTEINENLRRQKSPLNSGSDSDK